VRAEDELRADVGLAHNQGLAQSRIVVDALDKRWGVGTQSGDRDEFQVHPWGRHAFTPYSAKLLVRTLARPGK